MAASEQLYAELAKALGQPSRTFRAAQAGLAIPEEGLKGYEAGSELADKFNTRKLENQTLMEALGGQVPDSLKGYGGLKVKQFKPTAELLTGAGALDKALKDAKNKGLQFVGTQGKNGVLFDPNNGSVSTTALPESEDPIIPKAVTPTVTPYADPSGKPLVYTPGRGMAPVSSGNGTPVLKQGNEQAIGDVALMQSQAGNIDKLFNSYAQKNPAMARLQATPAGSIIDPETKQLENSLKLSAFTFGGKNLTGQEKQIVFGAFFPSVTDNAASLEQKRALLKDYFSGKVDLLQAANLLGPAGSTLKAMLNSKIQTPQAQPSFGNAKTPSFNTEQEAEASGYKGPAMIGGKRAVIH